MVDAEIYDLSKVFTKYNRTSTGYIVCFTPGDPIGVEEADNKSTSLNYTGKPGDASALYYSLFFQLPKWDWQVVKADEWIEVSPTHKEYYERTMSTKQMLESTIKTGLTSAAQAVSDYELMSHDIRKYREILGYFSSKDSHSLKAMFVDQVDIHTDMPGQPVSMRSIAPRWPTIIADFMRLDDGDTNIEAVGKKLNISKAEAVILVTKNKLYITWKDTFKTAAKERYMMLKSQVEARKKTVSQYKEWLKPYIARFKMTTLGNERKANRRVNMELFADVTGVSTFGNGVRIFTWKVIRSSDFRKPASELKHFRYGDFAVDPYDSWVRDHLILSSDTKNDYSLSMIYPWLRDPLKFCPICKKFFSANADECPKCGTMNIENRCMADKIVEENILPLWSKRQRGLDPYETYYIFLDYDILRVGTRLPSGEIEDITFEIKTCVMSQNVLLVKLLELECRSMELEKYIDQMLGLRVDDMSIEDVVKKEFPDLYDKKDVKKSESKEFMKEMRKSFGIYTNALDKLKAPSTGKPGKLRFSRPGNYEKEFKERISKNYSTVAGATFVGIVDFLKTKMGVN